MKKLVALLTLVATASAFSQGQVNFNTKVSSTGVDAPIRYAVGGPNVGGLIDSSLSRIDGAYDFGGINARAALYGGPGGTAADALSILTPSVPFRSGSAAGYVNVTTAMGGATRTVAGVPAGSPAVFQVRAWDTGAAGTASTSFEEASATILGQGAGYLGVSGLVNVDALTAAPSTPPSLVGLQGFEMAWVPEPSIIGLGILGAVAGMVVFRRRQ